MASNIEYDLGEGGDACHWGVSDFYESSEKKLIELLNSGEDFVATGSSKKEIAWFKVEKNNRSIRCTVYQSMDEDEDLIDDAFWGITQGREDGLSRSEIEEILDIMMLDEDFSSDAQHTVYLPPNASIDIEDIKTALDIGLVESDNLLRTSYVFVKGVVKEILESRGRSEFSIGG